MNTPRTYAKSPELEAAVIADPENDLPRLVSADWLDEHGDPHRAAFIRAQCALWDKNPADEDYRRRSPTPKRIATSRPVPARPT